MNIGSRIKTLRQQNNLRQAELAEKLHVSPQAVSKWENGQSEPDLDTINRLCQIFNISIAELTETKPPQTPQPTQPRVEQPVVETKIINGYCEKCKKPVGPGEYEVVGQGPQRIYCKSCLMRMREEARRQNSIESQKEMRSGNIWGIVMGVALLIILLITCISCQLEWFYYVIGSVVCVGAYTLVSQLIWGTNIVFDVFDFFCRSFSAPFGFIFELSLDGIVWLLTVKLAMWIICGILSSLWFAVGLVICVPMSLITWAFSLSKKREEIKTGRGSV